MKLNDDPLVSVIMPVYNADKYLERAVGSVLKQTYENWELIIVDDSSDDDTGKILDQIQNEKIRVFHNEKNRGTAYSRMKGIHQAKAEWIAFLDADDLWREDKLRRQMDLIAELDDPQLTFTGSAFMNDEGELFSYTMQVPEKIGYQELLKQNVISCSSVIVRKDLILKYPFPDVPVIHEDYAVWLRILQAVDYAYGVNEPLLVYRLASNSKSHNKLKAARMNWNTYRNAGVPFLKAVPSMISYTIRGIRKYRNLK